MLTVTYVDPLCDHQVLMVTFNYKLKYMVIYISVQNAVITVTFYFDTTMYYMLSWIGNVAQTLAFLVFIGFSSLLLSTSVTIST